MEGSFRYWLHSEADFVKKNFTKFLSLKCSAFHEIPKCEGPCKEKHNCYYDSGKDCHAGILGRVLKNASGKIILTSGNQAAAVDLRDAGASRLEAFCARLENQITTPMKRKIPRMAQEV